MSRLVLGLLETGWSGFRRADVFRTLGEVGARDFTGQRISVSRWERLSREAGVVAGDDWETRLGTYLKTQAATIDAERRSDEPFESTIARAERNRDTAYALQDFLIELCEWFAEIGEPDTWDDLSSWARGLIHCLIPPGDVARMPPEEKYAASVIERTLSGLAALDGTGSTPRAAVDPGVGGLHPAQPARRARLRRPGGGQLPEGGLRRHTERLPSRWLLPTLRRLSNNTSLAATEWRQADIHREGQGSAPWLSTSPSFAGSLQSTNAPSTGQEWRVRDAWARTPSAPRNLDDDVLGAVRDEEAATGEGSLRLGRELIPGD